MGNDIINSVDRALELILYLYHEGTPKGITEISKAFGIYKSTIYRTLVTLENRGFVKQNTETGKYWLGIRLYAIGSVVGDSIELKEVLRPFAKKLCEEYSETVNVAILDQADGDVYRSIIIHKEELAGQVLVAHSPVGPTSECHCSALGKCLLAFGKNVDLSIYTNENLHRYTSNTITNPEVFVNHIAKVRQQGYALDNQELETGLTCISAPILDRESFAVAAISLSGPTSRVRSGDFTKKINYVCGIAREASMSMQ